ncbi:threonylcarbamoyl-AMP synthase [Candidatus Nomurabacteria bacterium]|nr:threonylcarbamoyl-AMP synthase [Candidatus Nomurabacteria bacterium]
MASMKKVRLSSKNQQSVMDAVIEVLSRGGLVIYPTETCYGIAADATNPEAIQKLLAYKSKRQDKAISVAVTDQRMAARYVHLNKAAKNMYQNFLPGPITVISRGKGKLAPGVESSHGTQGIRIPDYPFVLELVRQYGKPITATSANVSYKKTPYAIRDVLDNTTAKQQSLIDLAIDAGTLPKRKPSTVVDTTLESIYVLREGGIPLDHKTVFTSHDLEDTQKFVTFICEKIDKYIGKKTIVFFLQGDLGAGKTTFTKMFAKKIGVKDIVVSPTYTICRQYQARAHQKKFQLVHMDTYRFFEPQEIDELDPKQLFAKPNIVVIEWANKVYDHVQQYVKGAIVVKILMQSITPEKKQFEYAIEE